MSLPALSGCSSGPPDYYPLDSERSWQYRVVSRVLDDERIQKYVVSNQGTAVYEGQTVFVQRVQSGHFRYFKKDETGIRRIAVRARGSLEPRADAEAPYVLKFPLKRNTQWQSLSRLRLIESRTFAREDKLYKRDLPVRLTYTIEDTEATVEVPAGRYRNCLKIKAAGVTRVPVDRGTASATVTVDLFDWYAPDVGLVKSVRHERSDSVFLQNGDFRLELEQVDT